MQYGLYVNQQEKYGPTVFHFGGYYTQNSMGIKTLYKTFMFAATVILYISTVLIKIPPPATCNLYKTDTHCHKARDSPIHRTVDLPNNLQNWAPYIMG